MNMLMILCLLFIGIMCLISYIIGGLKFMMLTTLIFLAFCVAWRIVVELNIRNSK